MLRTRNGRICWGSQHLHTQAETLRIRKTLAGQTVSRLQLLRLQVGPLDRSGRIHLIQLRCLQQNAIAPAFSVPPAFASEAELDHLGVAQEIEARVSDFGV